MTNDDAIKWLENLKQDIDQLRYDVRCHYEQAIDEICGLLKEQEPVTWSYEYNCFVCSNCGLRINDEVYYMMDEPISFCPVCGRKVKWDE